MTCQVCIEAVQSSVGTSDFRKPRPLALPLDPQKAAV